MSAVLVARVIEAVICAAPFVCVPLIVWRDAANPSGHYATEAARRVVERAEQ